MKAFFKIIKVAITTVLVVIAISIIALCAFRWWAANDAYQFQGNWEIAGTGKTVPITDNEITLTDDVTYSYTLDTFAKTINVKIGNYTGSSHYVFSADKSEIMLIDGTFNWAQTLTNDVSDLIESVGSGAWRADSAGYTLHENTLGTHTRLKRV